MNKIVLSLCLILIASAVVSARSSSKLENNGRLRKLYGAWNSRSVVLTYNNQSNQYYCPTTVGANSGNMMISLYGTDNIVTQTTSNQFNSYFNTNSMSTSFTTVRPASPYFTASGTGANIPISIRTSDGSTFNVGASQFSANSYGSGNNAVQITSLNTRQISNLGVNSYGYLALSVSNLIANNMGNVFSVYLDKYTRNGLLLFDTKDLSYSRDIFSTAYWTTNGSWSIQSGISTKLGSTDLGSGSYNLILDINQNVTGLPQTLFNQLITAFAQYGVTGCTADVIKPTCNYNGGIRDLPWIKLGNIGGSQRFWIPPKVYVAGTKQFGGVASQITLNFMALKSTFSNRDFPNTDIMNLNAASSSANAAYVTPEHVGDIIIDSSILTYYYATFEVNSDNSSGTVSLYVASGSAYVWFYYNWPRWCKITFIVFISVLVLVLIAGCIFGARKKRIQQQPPK